ncbi:hypothetical protein [Noviherbaspirillum pedocola]|uniref:Uncharacterized protein n=1 Tax=Noviherbaspirillum pedocola TaxID=2801341 RepID=A0A934VZW1_9BURK|nr:hypothetical protein [Noviherbaspirillum pedocola]MBK4733451.1 hypothetical protein [Noviherbaspirillum pedocola]
MKTRLCGKSPSENTQLSHQTFSAALLSALMTVFPCHAEDKDTRPSVYKIEPSDICAMKTEHATTRFTAPVTPIDIIKNIDIVLKSSPFIDGEFLNENNLSAIFGEHSFKWIDYMPEEKLIKMDASPAFPYNCIIQSTAIWRKFKIGENKVGISFGLVANINDILPECQSLTISNIKSILGEPSAIEPIFGTSPPPHGRIIRYGPQTDPLGHADIFYYLQSGNCKSEFSFTTLGSGVISGFHLSIKGSN